MNLLYEVKTLKENKLLRTNEEIERFECAMDNILSNEDNRDIKYLCEGFDDNTQNTEVMFGLIHAIESYDSIADIKLNLKELIYAIPNVYSYAEEWIKIMNKRILNDSVSLKYYIEIANTCDESLKSVLKQLMNEIKNDNPEKFSNSVDEFLANINK